MIRRMLAPAAVLAALFVGAVGASSLVSAASANLGFDHNGGAPDINAGPAYVVAGGDIDIPLVSQADPPGVATWTIDVEYNNSVLHATACVAPPSTGSACRVDYAANIARTVAANVVGMSGAFTMMTTTFHAIGSAGQCSALIAHVPELYDQDINPIDAVTVNGTVCIVGCADITGDGHVDLRDGLRLLLQMLSRRPYNPAFDLNGDHVINARDVALLVRQIGTSC